MGHCYFEMFQPLAMKVSVSCDLSGVKSNLPHFSCISLSSFELQTKTSIFIFIRSLNPSPSTVSARLWSIFTYISKSLFFPFFCFFLESFSSLVKPRFIFLFFAALTFVLSSVWAVLGFYPRFFLNGCLSSLDEGVSGAGPQRSFLHVENASFVVSWITTTWIPRWRCSLLLEWRFRFYPNLWAINTTLSWYVHNLVHNYFIDVKCLM